MSYESNYEMQLRNAFGRISMFQIVTMAISYYNKSLDNGRLPTAKQAIITELQHVVSGGRK